MSHVSLLIADVDGTLLTPSKVLTGRARSAILKLRDAGILLAITSSRPPRGLSMLVGPLGLTTPIAAFNGGMFVNPDLSLIAETPLPVEVVSPVIETLERHALDAWVYRGTDWFVRNPRGPHVEREQRAVLFSPTVVSDFDGLCGGVVKIVGVSDDPQLVAHCNDDVQSQFADHVLSATRSQPYYLDVTHADANKGAVVRRLSELLVIPTADIATIGDGANDVSMFAASGLSIAMGNAASSVRRAASRVTTSNEEEGFADAVERYIL